ncbi:BREX-1 system adenine-specific DNA-methyltransferase PglX [Luteimonas sp. MJ250]|uniref:BREX-1 system adenine-specific DNA-methyltransferase PglX n=1 Tax=Luteimonas sp. MJ250 TaxID=3129236 RepID=UPI0031BAC2FE
MNTGNLKSYAPQARKDFIAAVTARANLLGLSEAKGQLVVAEAKTSGDLVMIAGRPWPLRVNEQRRKLIARMQQQGFGQTVEAVAYSWFNRLAALRFMELHDYLGHGRRVLSNPQGGLPEVLTHALDLAEAGALPGLSVDAVRELKLANQDAELYRQVLIAQCNALHQAMPFLFESIGDETELLLPENLLLTDSVVNKLVQSVPEADWQQIEIIGWLYQFYISEKKDQVIGKVVKSEDLPAATQLFTPNWIVKYMVQNSLGAQWLMTYPQSPIKGRMEYYIEPAEQTAEVNAQLAATTPSLLNPEELTLIDPASGSGHILVESYELFKAIYLERGYRQRDIPQLILEKNLFGLDIDERAAQLTGFALMMKGRADDRQIFDRGLKLNVMALLDSAGVDAEGLAKGVNLSDYGLSAENLTELKRLFQHATTFGSLIQVPEDVASSLPALKRLSEAVSEDLFVSQSLTQLAPLVQQADLLAAQYDAVVANPPYMGSKGMNTLVKNFVKEKYPDAKSDLFACFIERSYKLASSTGHSAMVTMQSWMFLSSFQKMREQILRGKTIRTMAHLGARAFGSISGEVVQTTTFVLNNRSLLGYRPAFFRLLDGGEYEKRTALTGGQHRFDRINQQGFTGIPGSPIAYWLPAAALDAYRRGTGLGEVCYGQPGLQTSNNERFIRTWSEVSLSDVGFGLASSQDAAASCLRWFPYLKGGEARKWYGNHDHVVNWQDDGHAIKSYVNGKYPYLNGNIDYVVKDRGYYFRPGISYTKISTGQFSARMSGPGFLFDVAGSSVFPSANLLWTIGGLFGSTLAMLFLRAQNPTINIQSGDIDRIPLLSEALKAQQEPVQALVSQLVELARNDWDAYERSWDFQAHPLLTAFSESTPTVKSNFTDWMAQNRDAIAEMKRLEEENNRLFIDAYGLADELIPEVPIEQITLTVNPAYRYGGKLSEEEHLTRFRQDTMEELVSYAIGCMMGRYSLDAPGLIYAHAGNLGFDATRYKKFPADADGIVPLTDALWFDDDATLRVREFLLTLWGADTVEQNMTWLADNLGRKATESPEEGIRRYLAGKFFKDHLQTYKKRPIYWLFSSGKQGAFQALVYLHRYNAGTLSRLRAEYVIPLTGKMHARIEQLERDATTASSTAARNRANKQLESLRKKHLELLVYDEQLRHYADQRIELDLDDGVKVNYGKFGDLLAEVKSIVGKQGEE